MHPRAKTERAFAAGFEGERVHYTAVNPPGIDLDRVVELAADHPELTITVGAADTIERLAERGYDGRLCLRVNPGVGAGHHEKVRTGADAKFGVPYDRAGITARIGRGRLRRRGNPRPRRQWHLGRRPRESPRTRLAHG